MKTIVMYPANKDQLRAQKAIAKATKIDFEVKETPYDPKFVESILQGREDVRNGKRVKKAFEYLWK